MSDDFERALLISFDYSGGVDASLKVLILPPWMDPCTRGFSDGSESNECPTGTRQHVRSRREGEPRGLAPLLRAILDHGLHGDQVLVPPTLQEASAWQLLLPCMRPN